MRNGFLLCGVLASTLLLAPTLLMAQAPPEKLTEIESLRLQLSIEKQKRIQAQYDAAVGQCQQQKNIRQLMDESDKVTADQGKMLAEVFTAHHVDSTQFKVDPATGEFVPNQK